MALDPIGASAGAAGIVQPATPLVEARDLTFELNVHLAGVIAATDLLALEPEIPERVRLLLAGARQDLAAGAEHLERLRQLLDHLIHTPPSA